jgi:hypothetical protein
MRGGVKNVKDSRIMEIEPTPAESKESRKKKQNIIT